MIQRDLATALDRGGQSYETPCPLSVAAKEELSWWTEQLTRWNGKSLVLRNIDLTLESDASRTGWGASCQGVHTGGPWSPQERSYHINCLELLAASLVVKTFMKGLTNKRVPASAGQSDSGCIYKQFGWDSLRPSNVNCQKPLDVVPGEGHSTVCATSPRKEEYRSRLGVESDEGSLRLDAERVGFSSSSELFSLPERQLVRIPVDRSASEVLQLETRPSSGGYRRVSPGLERSIRLCQSSLEFNRESPLEGGGAAGGCDTECGQLNPGIPSSSVHWLQQDQSSARAGMGSSGRVPPRAPPPTGRVAYLRQHYVNQKLSGEASDLLLSSWRQKSAQSYDSLCKKWISWCSERNSDTVSGPIEDVVNFLAHLHTQGYQYCSLNSYRSAIASLHTPIDGVSIGQHPLVSRLLKGAFQTRPPLPRYTETWGCGCSAILPR